MGNGVFGGWIPDQVGNDNFLGALDSCTFPSSSTYDCGLQPEFIPKAVSGSE
jgi:hypothetical protein